MGIHQKIKLSAAEMDSCSYFDSTTGKLKLLSSSDRPVEGVVPVNDVLLPKIQSIAEKEIVWLQNFSPVGTETRIRAKVKCVEHNTRMSVTYASDQLKFQAPLVFKWVLGCKECCGIILKNAPPDEIIEEEEDDEQELVEERNQDVQLVEPCVEAGNRRIEEMENVIDMFNNLLRSIRSYKNNNDL
jgi:hypothetical protein